MKWHLLITLLFICFLQSCKLSDLTPSSPQITTDQAALKKFNHSQFAKTSCIECHEIHRPKSNPSHGENLNCIECHSAEIGINGKKSWLNIKNFSHNGNIQSCNKCHLTSNRDSRPEPKQNHPSAKYNQLDCIVCHQYKAPEKNWKNIIFNHNTHSPAPNSCGQCHEGTRPTSHIINPKTDGMKTTDCFACHGSTQNWNDRIKQFDHVSSNPQSCIQCHKNDAPKPAENHPSKKENYSKLECSLCHTFAVTNPNGKMKWSNLKFDHRTHQAETKSCLECHNNTLNRSLPTNGSHNSGSRKNLDCNQCHSFNSEKGWTLFTPFNHQKIESNETCESCHNAKARTLKYKTANHVQTNLTCVECHSTSAWKPASYKHQPIDTQCLDCHNGKTASGKPTNHTLQTQVQCSVCHNQERWSPAWYSTNYTHSQFGNLPPISIRGRMMNHEDANQCGRCHETKSDSVKYKNKESAPTCLGCHQKDFNSEYHRGGGSDRLKNCLQCHNYDDWEEVLHR